MMGKILQLLGISEDLANRLDKAELVWAHPWVLWLGLLALIPIGFFIVRRQRQNLPHVSPGMRGLMSGCRIGVLAVLVFVLASPSLKLEEEVTQKPIVAFVIDESASMDLPAGPFSDDEAARLAVATGLVPAPEKDKPAAPLTPEIRKQLNTMTRQQLVDAVIAASGERVTKPLEERFDLKVYRTARDVRLASLTPATQPAAAAVEGLETNLGGAIDKVIDDASTRRIAGIVVVSDGRWTSGPDPMAVAQRLTGRGAPTPIWSLPVGSATPMADASLIDVLAPPQVSEGDSVAVVATVESRGLDNKTVQVKLLREGKEIDTRPLTLKAGERQQVQLALDTKKAIGDGAPPTGPTQLTIAIDEQPEEQVKENNRQTAMINVGGDKLKVLYLEGSPRWDFRFLDHALRRDQGLEQPVKFVMEAQLVGAGTAASDLPTAAGLPDDAAKFAEYGVVILGDISPALLPVRLQEQLVKAVEEDGLGLIVQAGSEHMPVDFANGPLARLLPVKIEDVRHRQKVMLASSTVASGLEAPDFQPFRMKVTATGSLHPAFQIYDSVTQNRTVWSRMPEFYWAAASEDAGSSATVLAKLEGVPGRQDLPLIAERYTGRGRVLFIGTDSTYRWRRNIGNHLFYRFWGQAIRHVARNKDRAADSSWMEASPRRIEPGDAASIELYAVDGAGEPLDAGEISVQVTGEDRSDRIRISRSPQKGYFRGLWQPRGAGSYRLSYTDERGKVVTAAVEVVRSGRELRRPIVDREMLGTLADSTGGGLLELDEIGRLPELLKGEAVTVKRVDEESIWDNWLTLVLLVGLYCTDVGVRRLLGLT